MAYVFQTFTVGQVLTAAQMNQVEVNVRDHVHGQNGVSAVNLPAARMRSNVSCGLGFTAPASWFLAWLVSDIDTASYFNTASNTRLTFANTARALVTADLDITQTVDMGNAWIILNRTTKIAKAIVSSNRALAETIYQFNASDYIEVNVETNSGVTITINNNANYSPIFALVQL